MNTQKYKARKNRKTQARITQIYTTNSFIFGKNGTHTKELFLLFFSYIFYLLKVEIESAEGVKEKILR